MRASATSSSGRPSLAVLTLTVGAACATPTSTSTVDIYSWWITGAEQSAFDAVRRDFQAKYPSYAVDNLAAQNAATAQSELASRMQLGDPPDTFQVNGGLELLTYLPTNATELEPLDAAPMDQSWRTAVAPEALLAVSQLLDGQHVYAVPVDLARVNALFYNKQVLDKLGRAPPQTVADFAAMAPVLKANHVTPLAVGDAAPWTLEVIFKQCLVACCGDARYYREFTQGNNPHFKSTGVASNDPDFDAAVDCFATMVADVDTSTARTKTWDAAVQDVANQSAAMTVMGDWAVGVFKKRGQTFGVEFGEVPAPGSASAFIYTTDTFVLPKGAKNRSGAIALLQEWSSRDGQSAFYQLKGSLPARFDAADSSDPFVELTMNDFNQAHDAMSTVPDFPLAVPQAFSTALDAALDRFLDDRNAENLVLAARNAYDLVVQQHWPP